MFLILVALLCTWCYLGPSLQVNIITRSAHHVMNPTKTYFVIGHATQAAIIGTTIPVSPLRIKSLQFNSIEVRAPVAVTFHWKYSKYQTSNYV